MSKSHAIPRKANGSDSSEGVQSIVDGLSRHTSESLASLLKADVFMQAVKIAHIVTCVSALGICRGLKVLAFIRELGDEHDKLFPLDIHETWQELSTHWAMSEQFVVSDMSKIIDDVSTSKLRKLTVSSTCELLLTTAKALTSTCRKCHKVFFSDINRTWCAASHVYGPQQGPAVQHDPCLLQRHWDSMSHDERRALVEPVAPTGTYQPLNPLAKKMWTILKGQVEVSGSTLLECIDQVTEGTHLLRVSAPDLKMHMTQDDICDPRDVLALIAHHVMTCIAASYADANAAKLMEEIDREHCAAEDRRRSREHKKHMRWVEKTIFRGDYHVPWDIE